MSEHTTNGNAKWQTVASWAIIAGAIITTYVRSEVRQAALEANQRRIETQMDRRGQLSFMRDEFLWTEIDEVSISARGRGVQRPPPYMSESPTP